LGGEEIKKPESPKKEEVKQQKQAAEKHDEDVKKELNKNAKIKDKLK